MKRERKKENKEKVEELENGRRISGGKKKNDENEEGMKRISRSTNVDLQHSFVLNPLSLITTD